MTTPDPAPPTVTRQQVRECRDAARSHAAMMRQLHRDVEKVAFTAARLAVALITPLAPLTEDHPLYVKVDLAMGRLGEAYSQLAATFDEHLEKHK